MRKMLLYLSIALFLMGTLTLSGRATENGHEADTGFLTKMVTLNHRAYPYVLYVPADYNQKARCPLIMDLHGIGTRGSDGLFQFNTGLVQAIIGDRGRLDHWPFLVIVPQCPNKLTWADMDPELLAMLAQVEQEYRIDTDRVYLTGESLGGIGTWSFGVAHPDLFAALAPLCANGDPKTTGPLQGMPVWAFHGAKDNVVSPVGGRAMADAAKASGADVRWTLYPDLGHDIWTKVYRDEPLGDWFLLHKRSDRIKK